jgi:nucleotide-binding universal stress UspA family protein
LADVPVKQVFLVGEVVPTLHRAAVTGAADLVVMTTHGRGALGRFWLGSVADELMRELPMPLLLVRPHSDTPAYDPEPVLKHILLPLDGTALAEQMLEPAFQLGSLFDADYTLMRVVKPALPTTYAIEGFTPTQAAESVLDQIEQLQEQSSREAQAYLDGVARRLTERTAGEKLTIRTRVAMEHQPAAAILQEAVPPIDLIALETHGRRGLSRLFLGSVADKVIRGSSLPVLVHKPVH